MLPRGCSPSPGNRRRPERPFPGSESKVSGNGPGQSRPQSPFSPGTGPPSARRPLTAWFSAPVPHRRPSAHPRRPPGRSAGCQTPAASPQPAHLRVPSPPSPPSPGVWNRPAAPPPALPALAPPPRSRNCSLPGPFPRLPGSPSVASLPPVPGGAPAVGVSRTRRAGSVPEPGARAPRMTTNSSRGRCGGVRLTVASGPAVSPRALLYPLSSAEKDPPRNLPPRAWG